MSPQASGCERNLKVAATNFPRADLRQIFHEPIRRVWFQFMMLRAARRHGQNACADKFSTTNIKLRVAHDNDLFRPQMFSDNTLPAFKCRDRDVISIFVVIRKSAEMKNFPKPEMPQLDFCAEPDIAGEQTKRRRIWQREQIANEMLDTMTCRAIALPHDVVETESVVIEKFSEIFRRRANAMNAKKLPRKAHVCATGKTDFL